MARRTPRINPWKLFHGAFVPNWLLRRSECSQGGKLMYARLSQYAGEDGFCFPSQGQLSQELGVSDRQVRTYISELIRLKLIEKERCGLRKTDRYYFRMHPWIKAEMSPPVRADATPQNANRKDTSTLDRKDTSTLDRKDTSKKLTAVPSAPKPSGRLRDSVVRDSAKENQLPPPPTPSAEIMAPRSSDVGEVGQPVAIAEGEETKATDGGIASAMDPTPFDAFFVAYPWHKGIRKAQAEWDRQQLNATLPDILAALSWQKTLTGTKALPEWPHVYLENKGWLDARPVSPVARPYKDWDEDEQRQCTEPDCPNPRDLTLSDKKCEMHAGEQLTIEAGAFLDIMSGRTYEDRYGGETEATRPERVMKLADRYHLEPKGCALAVAQCLNSHYGKAGPCVEASFLANRIAEVVREARGYPTPKLELVV